MAQLCSTRSATTLAPAVETTAARAWEGSSAATAGAAVSAAAVTVAATGKVYTFKPLGDVRPVVEAGGLFNFARHSGMIPAA